MNTAAFLQFIELLFCLLDIILLYQFSRIILVRRSQNFFYLIASIILATFLLYLANMKAYYSTLATLFSAIILIIFVIIDFKGHFLALIVVPLFYYIVVGILTMLITSAIVTFTGLKISDLFDQFLYRILTTTLIKTCVFIIIHEFSRRRDQVDQIARSRNLLVYFGTSLVVLVLAFEVLILENEAVSHTLVLFLLVLFMVSFVAMMLLVMRYYRVRVETQKKQDQLEDASLKQREYIQQLENQKEVMKLKHDLRNHLVALRSLVDHDDREKALKYLESLQGHPALRSYVNSENEIMNALLNAKISESPDIHFDVRHDDGRFDFPAPDLSVLLGNALDNAIESVRQLPAEERQILIIFTENALFAKLVIDNPYLQEPIVIDGVLYSHKRENRKGLGIQNMEAVIKQNGGELDYSMDNQRFRLVILLKKSTK